MTGWKFAQASVFSDPDGVVEPLLGPLVQSVNDARGISVMTEGGARLFVYRLLNMFAAMKFYPGVNAVPFFPKRGDKYNAVEHEAINTRLFKKAPDTIAHACFPGLKTKNGEVVVKATVAFPVEVAPEPAAPQRGSGATPARAASPHRSARAVFTPPQARVLPRTCARRSIAICS